MAGLALGGLSFSVLYHSEGSSVPWKSLLSCLIPRELMALFRAFWRHYGENYTLLHVVSELPIVLLALSVRLVVQARVGMLLW